MNPSDLGDDFMNFANRAGSQGNAIYYRPGQVVADVPGPTPQQTNLPATHSAGGVLGFLERNAQNIGGVLGGIGGEILNPFGGGVAGAGIGSALGQEIKNLTTGTKTNPFEEGALGAASELGGQVIGKAAGSGISKLANVADRYGSNILSQVGGTVDRRTARALNAQGTTRFMSDLGVNPSEHKAVSQGVINTLTPLVNKGVGQAGQVDTTGINDIANNMIDNHMGIDGISSQKGTAANKLSNSIKGMMDKLNGVENENGSPLARQGKPGDVLNPGANPNDTLDTIKSLRSDAARLTGKGKNPLTVTDAARAEADVKNSVADELEDRLYNDGEIAPGIKGAGADKMVNKGLVDNASISKLQSILPNTPKSQEFINAIKNASTIRELRSAQAPFVNAAQLAAEKEAGKATLGTTSGQLVKQGIGAGGVAAAPFTGGASALIPAAELALGTDTGKTLVGNGLRFAAKQGDKIGTPNNPVLKTARNIINKTAQQTTGQDLTGLASGGSNESNGPVSSLVNNSINSTIAPLIAAKNGSPTTGLGAITSPEQLQNVINAVGYKGLDAYLATQKQESPQLTEKQQEDWTNAQNAINAIQDFAKTFEQVKASGAVAGGIEELGTKIPGIQNTKSEASLKTYNDNVGDLASTLSQVLGGGRGSKALLQELKSELPGVNDSPQAAAMKLNIVVQRLGQTMNTILSAPATNTPGQLANFSGMTVPGTVQSTLPLPATPSQVNFSGGL